MQTVSHTKSSHQASWRGNVAYTITSSWRYITCLTKISCTFNLVWLCVYSSDELGHTFQTIVFPKYQAKTHRVTLKRRWRICLKLSDLFQHSLVSILKLRRLLGAVRIRSGESGTPSTISLWINRRGGPGWHILMDHSRSNLLILISGIKHTHLVFHCAWQ